MHIKIYQLKKFLEKNIIKQTIKKLKNLNRGGTSINFYCETDDKKYIIKVISKEKRQRVERLCKIFNSLSENHYIYTAQIQKFHNQEIFEYENYLLIIISYISGHQFSARKITPKIINQIFTSYKHISQLNIEGGYQKNLQQIYLENKKILNELHKNNLGFIRNKILICINKLNEKLSTKIVLNKNIKLIHGDASLNNCLLDKDGNVAILDFELIRFGYEIEDWSEFLLSSLLQHSIIIIPQKHLERLIKHINSLFNFTKQEWLYGINLYFLNLINKRLKSQKLFKSTRKSILFTLNLHKYNAILKLLNKIY